MFSFRYREICIETLNSAADSGMESWCCQMQESGSTQNEAVLLDNCNLADVIVSTVQYADLS